MSKYSNNFVEARDTRRLSDMNNVTPERLAIEITKIIDAAAENGNYEVQYLFHSQVTDQTLKLLRASLINFGYKVMVLEGLGSDRGFNISWEDAE